MKWQILNSSTPHTQAELEEVLLSNRGITDAKTFFQPPHPSKLSLVEVGLDGTKMAAAIERIQQAIQRKEKIIVFGDYDADGICATAVMWLSLQHLGCQVMPFIPDRIRHGYGLSTKAIDDILAQGKPDLIVTVDNGIVAHPAVEKLNQAGVEVILTDHHSPEATLPAASHIVHTTQLCGATVAWMFGRELTKAIMGETETPNELLDLCGIATIADQVPLKGANRAFAYWGIEALKTTPRPGIKAICQAADISQADLTTNGVHYGIAPRINAMGRLEHGMDALRILCTSNAERAQALAQSISLTNVKRQTLTTDLLDIALAQSKVWETEHLIIVDSPDFHEGVIGLIAGKLMETYYKPAIVIAVSEGKAKASARSIAGVNIVELIRLVKDDLLEVGGHPMAAGFGLLPEKIPVVRERLLALAKLQITVEALVPTLDLESILPLELVTEETVETLARFEPFGQGNPKPRWGLPPTRVVTAAPIGSQQQHLKLSVSQAEDTSSKQALTCLAWNYFPGNEMPVVGTLIEVAGELESKTWRNKTSLQVVIKDLKMV